MFQKSVSPLDPKWLESIWQNLFKTQTSIVPVDNGLNLTSADAHTPTLTPEKTQKTHGSEEWKRSRPKRGQYRSVIEMMIPNTLHYFRKYDKNALDEAVRSVRRGEMTVHRAGSFFGVPHSTLEYKVIVNKIILKMIISVTNISGERKKPDEEKERP